MPASRATARRSRLSPTDRLDRTVSEAELQANVLELARALDWRSAHFRPGLTRSGSWATAVSGDGVGFPDLILVRGFRLLAVELKREGGRLTEEQGRWLAALEAAGVEVYVWRPRDWRSGRIETTLGRGVR